METLSDEAATDGATRVAEVAQAAQVEGLPDLDHARYFPAVSAAVSAAVIATAVGGRVYYLVRALF